MDRIDVARILSAFARFFGTAMLFAIMSSGTAAHPQTFSTPGPWTYTVPAGVNTIQVLVAGGGGGGAGGGSSNPSVAPGGAGGNGARITAIVTVTPGQILSGTIGGGGITGFSAGSSAFGLTACTGSGGGGSGVGGGGSGANTNCLGTGSSGGGGGGCGGTTFAVNGTVLLQAGGGGGGGGWGGGSASAGTTNATLQSSVLCGLSATGFSSANFLLDGGGGGGGGGGFTAGLAGLSALDILPVGSGGGGGNCRSGSSAITSIAISANGGAGASGVPAITTAAGPAGGSGYVTISTSAIAVSTSSASIQDGVSAANPKSVPGATMEYCLLMSNNWSTNVSGLTVLVQVAPNQTYIDGSAKAGTTCAAAIPAPGVTHNAGTLTAASANIPANASYALVYQANID